MFFLLSFAIDKMFLLQKSSCGRYWSISWKFWNQIFFISFSASSICDSMYFSFHCLFIWYFIDVYVMLLSIYHVTIFSNILLLYINPQLSSCVWFSQFVSAIFSVKQLVFLTVSLCFCWLFHSVFLTVSLYFFVCFTLFLFPLIFSDLLKLGSNKSNNSLHSISQVILYLTKSHRILSISSISLVLAYSISLSGILTVFLMLLLL